MIVAIMQPYFFPYIGYFQLLAAADVFVVLDDVQYMKGGWINRNRIRVNGVPKWLTMPVEKASLQLNINERSYRASPADRRAILDAVTAAYRTAPMFGQVMPLIEKVMAFPDANVAAFNANLIDCVSRELKLDCEIVRSSAIAKPPELRGQDRVLALCEALEASTYVNAIGGLELYDSADFRGRGIELRFVKTRPVETAQSQESITPAFSIIDVMMHSDVEKRAEMLRSYELIADGD